MTKSRQDEISEAREFWIIREEGFSALVSDKPLNSADTTEEIHVIEHSAFQALERKLHVAIEALRDIKSDNNAHCFCCKWSEQALAKIDGLALNGRSEEPTPKGVDVRKLFHGVFDGNEMLGDDT